LPGLAVIRLFASYSYAAEFAGSSRFPAASYANDSLAGSPSAV
jgi:hypothetical protein